MWIVICELNSRVLKCIHIGTRTTSTTRFNLNWGFSKIFRSDSEFFLYCRSEMWFSLPQRMHVSLAPSKYYFQCRVNVHKVKKIPQYSDLMKLIVQKVRKRSGKVWKSPKSPKKSKKFRKFQKILQSIRGLESYQSLDCVV